MRILIVDDEKDFVGMLLERFRRGNMEIDCAYDGKQALELIKSKKYDVVILDQNMPEMTGLEVVKYMKDNDVASKKVMITGYVAINGFFAKTIGVDDYLTKPVKLEEVEKVLEKYRC